MAVQAAKGSANPNEKGSWEWYLWELDTSLTGYTATKDVAVRKALSKRIEEATAGLVKLLSEGVLEDGDAARIGLYLAAQNIDVTKKGLLAESRERLKSQYAAQSKSILEYLFKAGVPLPTKLPASLSFEAWKQEYDAFVIFHDATSPDEQSEYETAEGTPRAARNGGGSSTSS